VIAQGASLDYCYSLIEDCTIRFGVVPLYYITVRSNYSHVTALHNLHLGRLSLEIWGSGYCIIS
jgi:hypothetical protein